MLQAKDLKDKIKSIKSINHITKAMKMVATAKLKKSQRQMNAIKPYSNKVEELVNNLVNQCENIENPYMKNKKEPESMLLLIISSDKGLCSSYNTNIAREFEKLYRKNGWKDKKISIVTMGKKITDYMLKNKYELHKSFINNKNAPTMEELKSFFETIITPFVEGDVDEVKILHTKYINNVNNRIEETKLLPITFLSQPGEKEEENEFLFDPSRDEIFDFLMPRFVRTKLYSLLINSITSEHAVRMTSMEHATEKSTEMIEELELKLNKIRQEAITLELLDIISGSEALKN